MALECFPYYFFSSSVHNRLGVYYILPSPDKYSFLTQQGHVRLEGRHKPNLNTRIRAEFLHPDSEISQRLADYHFRQDVTTEFKEHIARVSLLSRILPTDEELQWYAKALHLVGASLNLTKTFGEVYETIWQKTREPHGSDQISLERIGPQENLPSVESLEKALQM